MSLVANATDDDKNYLPYLVVKMDPYLGQPEISHHVDLDAAEDRVVKLRQLGMLAGIYVFKKEVAKLLDDVIWLDSPEQQNLVSQFEG